MIKSWNSKIVCANCAQPAVSQMQLTKMLNISQSAVAKWELGKTEPTASAIIKIAKFFDESTDYILGLTD